MGVSSCLFVAKVPDPARARLESRIEALVRFYAPLGATDVSSVEAGRLVVGEIEFDSLDGGRGRGGREPLSEGTRLFADWGGALPPHLRSARALLEADDQNLRRIRGIGMALAADADRVRLVTSPVGPTALYVSESDGSRVWSTHAAAAAWLACGAVELRGDALPEFVVCEFVGGRETHLSGVDAVPPATRIDLRGSASSEYDYWPTAERWSAVPAQDAARVAEEALLAGLDGRLRDRPGPLCGLTSGADSRVVALALREMSEGGFSAFTYGDEGWPDVVGAEKVARTLGVPHERYGINWNTDDDSRNAIETAVRWSDGLEPVHGFGIPDVPKLPPAIVTGRGGETGRAFLYRFAARDHRRPTRPQLVDAVLASRPPRLEHADPGARETLRAAVTGWIDCAASSGQDGWHLLDVVYGEQRLTRWDRTRLMRQQSPYVPAFDDPDVQRALASLPLDVRLSDGFHRSFVERRMPALVPPPPPAPRRWVPAPVRRLARAVRASRRQLAEPERWFLADEWDRRPRTRDWICEELLAQPVLADVFGPAWAARLRTGFLAGDAFANRTAIALVAPLALDSSVRRELTG